MGFSELWSRTLVYFGIAEDEEWDEDGYVTNEQLEESYRQRDRQNVRRLPSAPEADEWAPEEPHRGRRQPARLRTVEPGPPAKVHLVDKSDFGLVNAPALLEVDVVWPVGHHLGDVRIVEKRVDGAVTEDIGGDLVEQRPPVGRGERETLFLVDCPLQHLEDAET